MVCGPTLQLCLCLIPLPLVSALFEHGETSRQDALAISYATAFSLGLPAFMIQKLLQPLYFAREDTKTPLRFAVISMLLNAILAIALLKVMGWIAVAVAASASAWVTSILLWITAKKYGRAASALKTSTNRIKRTFLASLVMGIIIWAISQNLYIAMQTSAERVFFAIGLVFAGSTIYLVIVYMLQAFPKNSEKALN